MPQLIASTGTSNTAIGVLVMIPYLAALVAMILVGQSSDRTSERRYHAAMPLSAGAISFILLSTITTRSSLLTVLLLCFVASGIESSWAPIWALPAEFLTGSAAAAGIALINSGGNIGSFVGPYAMGALSKTTGSFRGGLMLAGVSWFISALLLTALPRKPSR
jgi:ACS family tartrate transporter-like MFS transporter